MNINRLFIRAPKFNELAKYVDMFMFMTYYLDYDVKPEDVVNAALWVKELTGRATLAGVQLQPRES